MEPEGTVSHWSPTVSLPIAVVFTLAGGGNFDIVVCAGVPAAIGVSNTYHPMNAIPATNDTMQPNAGHRTQESLILPDPEWVCPTVEIRASTPKAMLTSRRIIAVSMKPVGPRDFVMF